MSSDTERINALEKRVSELEGKKLRFDIMMNLDPTLKRISILEVKLKHLEDYLATVPDLPILGPNHMRDYEEGKKKALAAANLA